MKMESIYIQKKGVNYEIKSLIERLDLVQDADYKIARITARFKNSQKDTGRPVDLLQALEINPDEVRIRRTQLILLLY